MKFTLTFDCDNAWFQGDDGEQDPLVTAFAVGTLLSRVGADIDARGVYNGLFPGDAAPLRDDNGNTVGKWELEP